MTFDDVAGVDEAKEELEEIVEFLKNPKKFQALGAQIPKGVLLVGPPGTGKTLLARAIAGEAGVPFFSISGSDFVEMFVGVGASRVRDLFEQAKKSAPCIVFIDEIDAVGRQRGAGLGGGHDEREQTLNQLLVEMDGFDPNTGVILIAATNRPDVLDPALLRPGRFDRQVVVDRPTSKGREQILKCTRSSKPLAQDVDARDARARARPDSRAPTSRTWSTRPRCSPRGATRCSHRDGRLEEAIDRVVAGPERKSRLISQTREGDHRVPRGGPRARRRAAAARRPDPQGDDHAARHGARVSPWPLPAEDSYTLTQERDPGRIAALLGGRVAEELTFGEITTGAANDFEHATELARRMVTRIRHVRQARADDARREARTRFLGPRLGEERNYSDEIAYEIDEEVRRIIDECYAASYNLLEMNIDKLHRLAEALLEHETVEGDDVDRLLSDAPQPSAARKPEIVVPEQAAAAAAPPKEDKPRVAGPLTFPPPEPA